MKKVSIIIPVYNAEKFLQPCIDSLLSQTYPDKEIILVDDSSTDNSFAIAKKNENEIVKVFRQANAGAAVARNTGLNHAAGELIQFMDVDDFLSVDKIEKQVIALEANLNKVAVCNYISFLEGDGLEVLKPDDQSSFIYSSNDPVEFLINLFGGNGESTFIQTNCWLVPRRIIEESGGWREYRCPDDDGEFFTRVLLKSDGIVNVPGVFNYYRRDKRVGKLSTNSDQKYIQNTLLTIDLKYRYLKRIISHEGLKEAFAKQYLDFAVHNFPMHRILSQIAWNRYKGLNTTAALPLLGGKLIEAVKNTVGWKTARYLKYFLR